MLRVVLLETLLEGTETKEPVLFFHLNEVSAVDGALPLDTRFNRVVVLAADAVQTLVDVLEDVTVVVDGGQKLLHGEVVARLTRADEVVETDIQGLPGLFELLGLTGRPVLG